MKPISLTLQTPLTLNRKSFTFGPEARLSKVLGVSLEVGPPDCGWEPIVGLPAQEVP